MFVVEWCADKQEMKEPKDCKITQRKRAAQTSSNKNKLYIN